MYEFGTPFGSLWLEVDGKRISFTSEDSSEFIQRIFDGWNSEEYLAEYPRDFLYEPLDLAITIVPIFPQDIFPIKRLTLKTDSHLVSRRVNGGSGENLVQSSFYDPKSKNALGIGIQIDEYSNDEGLFNIEIPFSYLDVTKESSEWCKFAIAFKNKARDVDEVDMAVFYML